eukprot:6172093-Pleurochrysis_carterae.AAC.1
MRDQKTGSEMVLSVAGGGDAGCGGGGGDAGGDAGGGGGGTLATGGLRERELSGLIVEQDVAEHEVTGGEGAVANVVELNGARQAGEGGIALGLEKVVGKGGGNRTLRRWALCRGVQNLHTAAQGVEERSHDTSRLDDKMGIGSQGRTGVHCLERASSVSTRAGDHVDFRERPLMENTSLERPDCWGESHRWGNCAGLKRGGSNCVVEEGANVPSNGRGVDVKGRKELGGAAPV